MRLCLASLLSLWAGLAFSDDRPVVVELFTSQGCAACPPADEILMDLASRPGIIALGLHVDYWDYLGWEDGLGLPENSARQRAYSIALDRSMIYTPQMVIDGRIDVVGSRLAEVMDAIMAAHDMPDPVDLNVTRAEDQWHIDLALTKGAEPVGRADLVLVQYVPQTLAEIGAGENKGQTVLYVNAVTQIETASGWDGQSPTRIVLPYAGEGHRAVLLQERGHGPILAAAILP